MKYIAPEIEIIMFETEDVVTTSSGSDDVGQTQF